MDDRRPQTNSIFILRSQRERLLTWLADLWIFRLPSGCPGYERGISIVQMHLPLAFNLKAVGLFTTITGRSEG